MTFDTDTVRTAISIAGFFFAVATAVYAWWIARDKQSAQQIESVRRQISELDHRLLTVEQENRYAPGRGDIEKLSDSVSRLHGDLREMSGRLGGINRAVDTMHRHLMDRDGSPPN